MRGTSPPRPQRRRQGVAGCGGPTRGAVGLRPPGSHAAWLSLTCTGHQDGGGMSWTSSQSRQSGWRLRRPDRRPPHQGQGQCYGHQGRQAQPEAGARGWHARRREKRARQSARPAREREHVRHETRPGILLAGRSGGPQGLPAPPATACLVCLAGPPHDWRRQPGQLDGTLHAAASAHVCEASEPGGGRAAFGMRRKLAAAWQPRPTHKCKPSTAICMKKQVYNGA